MPWAPELITSVRPTTIGSGRPSCVWPPSTTSRPRTRPAIFTSVESPLWLSSTTRSTFFASRSSITSFCAWSSWMPNVRSGTKRCGWDTGTYGNPWPMTPTLTPPTSLIVYGVEHGIVPVELLQLWQTKSPAKRPRDLAVAEQLLDALDPVGELPVRREHLDAELVHRPHHVLAARPERRRRALERVAAVEQQRLAGTLVAHALHQRREMRVATHAPVAGREGGEVEMESA